MEKGDIIYVTLPNQGGHEQHGSRPNIAIISRRVVAEMNMVIVVPVTHRLKQLRFPHTFRVEPSNQNGLTTPSVVLVNQLRVLDLGREPFYVQGRLEGHYLKQLDEELRRMLGL